MGEQHIWAARLAVLSGTALHRGEELRAGTGVRVFISPSSPGRPFIEARRPVMPMRWSSSPSSPGRPFIEATTRRSQPCRSRRLAVLSGTALHRGTQDAAYTTRTRVSSPSSPGRPFIEAPARMNEASAGTWTSPSSPGRPFIEAGSSGRRASRRDPARRPLRDGPSSRRDLPARATVQRRAARRPLRDGPSSRLSLSRPKLALDFPLAVLSGTALHRGLARSGILALLIELAVLSGTALHRGPSRTF